MTIWHVLSVLLLAGFPVLAQSGEMGSMRDPRQAGQTGGGVIQPWLAVSGNYDTYLDQPAGSVGYVRRSISLGGGLSATKSFQRTVLSFGYSGSGSDYLGQTAGLREGWRSSNVGTLAVSSQVSQRLTLDFSESGGASNGGFGAAAAGLQAGGLGILSSVNLASGFLFRGGGATSGLDPLQNNLVDSDYYMQMAYFSSTAANAGYLLTKRTMLNVGGSAAFVRREGSGYSDANLVGANAMLSTQVSQRLTTFLGYTFNRIDYVRSIGNTYIQGGFAGLSYVLSPHDQISLSVNDSYVESKFVSAVKLPDDLAALLGVSYTTVVNNSGRSYLGGKLTYVHEFQRGGFSLSCSSMVTPGNDLVLLSRTQGCSTALSRRLTPRLSVTGVGGLRRLDGVSGSRGRYDVATGGLVFGYHIARGLSFNAGANYRATEVHPSSKSASDVSGTAGLSWTPEGGPRLF